MPQTTAGDVTQLLKQWNDGNQEALSQLMPLVHSELRQLASNHLRQERKDHTLETGALVNEAYLRLVDLKKVDSRSRVQFYSLASQVIRNILVDHARAHLTTKRGSGVRTKPLDEAMMVSVDKAEELVALDDALKALEALYPQQAKIVELRQFGGLTSEEIGETLGISAATVSRGWRMARAWLYRQLGAAERE